MATWQEDRAAWIASLPPFTDDAYDRLVHTLAACSGYHDDDIMVTATATSGDQPGPRWTGLTMRDLRNLQETLEDLLKRHGAL
jgi:hypothetical protein